MIKSYIWKNIFVFLSVILASVFLISSVQFFLLGKDAAGLAVIRLEEINKSFEKKIPIYVSESYQLVDFLTMTSYPEVALEFQMTEQFNAIVRSLVPSNSELKVVLLDKNANPVQEHKNAVELPFEVRRRILKKNEKEIYVFNEQVFYLMPYQQKGFLLGIQSASNVVRKIKNSYAAEVLEFQRLSPRMDVVLLNGNIVEGTKTVYYFNSPPVLFSDFLNWVSLPLLLIVLVVLCVGFLLVRGTLKKPMDHVMEVVRFVGTNKNSRDYAGKLPEDPNFKKIAEALFAMNNERILTEERERERIVASELAEIAKQVAHDIRSPLAALQVAFGAIGTSDPAIKEIGTIAMSRIRDIANSLLQRSKFINDEVTKDKTVPIPIILKALHEIVAEKRLQYKDSPGVEISFVSKVSRTDNCLVLNVGLLQRIVSNLINNAVEALNGSGVVTVAVSESMVNFQLVIQDNGSGISEEVLQKIGVSQFSSKKFSSESGSGLGLYHAKQILAKWKSDMKISTTKDCGTRIELYFPYQDNECQRIGKDL